MWHDLAKVVEDIVVAEQRKTYERDFHLNLVHKNNVAKNLNILLTMLLIQKLDGTANILEQVVIEVKTSPKLLQKPSNETSMHRFVSESKTNYETISSHRQCNITFLDQLLIIYNCRKCRQC